MAAYNVETSAAGVRPSTTLACPICKSREISAYAIVGEGSQRNGVETYRVLRCRAHGVEFADAVPVDSASDAARKGSLDRTYGTLDEGTKARYADFMDRVERVVGAAPGRLHDVGCGNGQLLYEARRRGWQVQGNDLVGGVRSGLEQRGIAFYHGSLAQLSPSPESCDVVTSFCVLPHHLVEPDPEMQAAYAMLKPGGWLVLQLPDNGTLRLAGKALYALLAGFRPRTARWILANLYGPGGHQYAFNPTNITEYLEKIGFAEIIIEPYYPAVGPTLARFQSAGLSTRLAASASVRSLRLLSRISGLPNHMIAFAKKSRRNSPSSVLGKKTTAEADGNPACGRNHA